MTSHVLIDHAATAAFNLHVGQFRRDGVTPYISHPMRVATQLQLRGAPAEIIATAWLHDVLEDTPVQREELILRYQIPDVIVDKVELLSFRHVDPDDTYEEYIDRIAHDPVARPVKTEDILDNLYGTPSMKQLMKYRAALARLTCVV